MNIQLIPGKTLKIGSQELHVSGGAHFNVKGNKSWPGWVAFSINQPNMFFFLPDGVKGTPIIAVATSAMYRAHEIVGDLAIIKETIKGPWEAIEYDPDIVPLPTQPGFFCHALTDLMVDQNQQLPIFGPGPWAQAEEVNQFTLFTARKRGEPNKGILCLLGRSPFSSSAWYVDLLPGNTSVY